MDQVASPHGGLEGTWEWCPRRAPAFPRRHISVPPPHAPQLDLTSSGTSSVFQPSPKFAKSDVWFSHFRYCFWIIYGREGEILALIQHPPPAPVWGEGNWGRKQGWWQWKEKHQVPGSCGRKDSDLGAQRMGGWRWHTPRLQDLPSWERHPTFTELWVELKDPLTDF